MKGIRKGWPPAHPGAGASEKAVYAYYKATACLEDAKFLVAHAFGRMPEETRQALVAFIEELERRPATAADKRMLAHFRMGVRSGLRSWENRSSAVLKNLDQTARW